jgi:outer membrane lipase/esterase
MFWEATHPGFTIQNLIAELMNGTLQTVLSGPQTIAVQSQLGMAAAESRREIAAERLAKTEEEGFRPFVESGYSGGTARATSDRSGFTYGQSLYAFGGEYRFDPATFVGSYFSYAGNNADLSNNAGSVGLETYGLDVYAGFRTNGWNGLAQFGAIRDDFNKISRASGYAFAPTASASTTGWTEQLNAEGGYAWPLGGPLEGLSVGPYGGLDVTRIDIAGYQESGTRLLNLAVQGRGVTSVVGSLGVQLNGTLNANGILFKPRADIAFERELGFDTDSVVASLSDGQTATVNAGPGARDAFRLRLGCDVILGQGLTAGASYSQIVTRDGNSNYGGRVDIAYHF